MADNNPFTSLLPEQDATDVAAPLLENLLDRQARELEAAREAERQSAGILSVLQNTQEQVYGKVTEAYDNQQRINRLPGGADGTVARLLGLFDSDWSVDAQQTTIQAENARLTEAASRAETMMQINQQSRNVAAVDTELARTQFQGALQMQELEDREFQRRADVARLGMEQTRIQHAERGLDYEAQRVRIALSQEERARVDQEVLNLGDTGARTALAEAQAGRGQWVGREGLLEAYIRNSEMAELQLQQYTSAVEDNNRERAVAALTGFVDRIPPLALGQAIQAAEQQGSPVVMIGEVEVPYNIAVRSFNAMRTDEADMQTALVAEEAAALDVGNRRTRVNSTLAAIAPLSSEAADIYETQSEQLARTDLNTYEGVRRMNNILTASETAVKPLVDRIVSQQPTEQSQNAMRAYLESGGRATPTGAQVIVRDAIGNWGVAQSSGMPGAWDALSRRVVEANGGVVGAMDDAMIQLNSLFGGANTSETTRARAIGRVLDDPETRAEVGKIASDTIGGNAILSTLERLANPQQPTAGARRVADPVWQDALAHKEEYMNIVENADGSINMVESELDEARLATYLERQSVIRGRVVDYNSAFTNALRTTATQGGAADPSLTPFDQNLLTHIYGADPHRAILNSFVNRFQQQAIQTRERIQRAIEQETADTAAAATGIQVGDTGPTGARRTQQLLTRPSVAVPELTIEELMNRQRTPIPGR